METESRRNCAYWITFPKSLDSILKERKIRRSALAGMLGIEPTTVSSWMHGRKTPSATRLFEMADLLEVSLDELVGRKLPRRKKRKSKKAAGRTASKPRKRTKTQSTKKD